MFITCIECGAFDRFTREELLEGMGEAELVQPFTCVQSMTGKVALKGASGDVADPGEVSEVITGGAGQVLPSGFVAQSAAGGIGLM